MVETSKLNKVYNGNERIINSGFTMQTNYLIPVLSRMVDEGLLNISGLTVTQTILTYKHTEKNPFPTQRELAKRLGKTTEYIKKAIKSIKTTGILKVTKAIDAKTGKKKRNNQYDFSPLFDLIEKFIIEYNDNQNFTVKIADLLKMQVIKSSEKKDFSFSEEYQDEKTVVPSANEEVSEEAQKEPEQINLPEKIVTLLEANGIDKKGINAVELKYAKYRGSLDDLLFAQKISTASSKNNFIAFFNTCIDNAFMNDEKPSIEPERNNYGTGRTAKPTRKEHTPEWLLKKLEEEAKAKENEVTEEKVQVYETPSEKVFNASAEDFEEMIAYHNKHKHKSTYQSNIHFVANIKMIEARLNNSNISLSELQKIEKDSHNMMKGMTA